MKYTGRQGWKASRKDTWSLTHTFNPMILAGLRAFRDIEKHGVPSCIVDHEASEKDWKTEIARADKEWHEILDKMIYAFDESNDPDMDNYDFHFKREKIEEESSEHFTRVKLKVIGEDEHARYIEDEEHYKIKRQEGLDLFAKYYNDLWW